MKRGSEEIAEEILQRVALLEASDKRRRSLMIKTVLLAVCFLVIIILAALVLSSGVNSGGYVMAGAVSFALGMAVTLLCLRLRKK